LSFLVLSAKGFAMIMPTKTARKHLSADSLVRLLRARFDRIADPRGRNADIPLGDALMSAFAMFALKDPSLLAFDERRLDPNDNFRSIYLLDRIPCDTQMRAILDPVAPAALRPVFSDIFRRLQRGKVLERFVYLNGHYLISLDGTKYFSSKKVHCPSCLVKHHRNGSVTYQHQMLGACLVHPDLKEVIPLAPEPIINQDGHNKNDCERNATRRWLQHFRREHPRLPVIVIEDALSANAPHLRDLRDHGMHYIISVKPGDHAFLFQQLHDADQAGRTQTLTEVEPATGMLHHYRFHHNVPLNESNPDELVNVLEYWEIDRHGNGQYFSWITDLALSPDSVYAVMRGGRARWKIENETFNTLKNQGYHFEHNYGHGVQNLSVVLALLMLLAFLVDQTQQLCCPLFQAAWRKAGSKRHLWEEVRTFFRIFRFDSWAELLTALIRGIALQRPVLQNAQDSS
jgi:Transposase DDE domain